MIKIELLIPLAYFGIVRTLSTETAKTAHFVLLLPSPAWAEGTVLSLCVCVCVTTKLL